MVTAATVRSVGRDARTVAGRAALIARGALYCIAALLAARLALGNDEHVDREAALQRVVEQPFGKLLVGALAAGFVSAVAWRSVRAWQGDGWATRLGDVGRAAIYAVLLVTALRLLFDEPGQPSGDSRAKEWTARLLDATGGRLLVTLVGLVVVVVGLVVAWCGVRMTFDDRLRLGEMSPRERRWLPRVGLAGYVARGVVFALIGIFVARAAIDYDPGEAVGVDGALHRLLEPAAGRVMVLVVAVGLLSFGAFSFVEARWRVELDD